MFLPNYKFDIDLGIWVSRDEKEQQQRMWLGEVDYSSGTMGTKQTVVRKLMPFTVSNQQARKGFADYIKLAEDHLLFTVENYKSAFGKSGVDQSRLVPDEYHELVWFLFPSQVLPELLQIGKVVAFETLKAIGEKADQSGNFTTIFKPRDYNTGVFKDHA